MGLETVAKISDLNPLWPLGSDSRSQMDDHLRNIKVAVQTSTREKLTATYNLYVRTDGSDSNTGLANTSGAAFLTIQAAVNKLYTLDCNSQTVNINVADGTYTGVITVAARRIVGLSSLNIIGNTGTPANVFLNVTGTVLKVTGPGYVKITGAKLQASVNCVEASGPGAQAEAETVTWGTAAVHVVAYNSGEVNLSGNQTITGAANSHLSATYAGRIFTSAYGATTTTISGTPAFATAFALASRLGQILNFGTTYSGSATGVRYSSTLNALVDSSGGGASYFPGNSAGSTATGGLYG